MNVKEIIEAAQKAGANVGEAYSTESVVAEQVEGIVIADPKGFGYRLLIQDASGKIQPKISTNSYVAGKTKYNLAIQKLDRDITLTGGGKLERGLKQLRAI